MRLDIKAIKKTMMTRTIRRLFICYFALWLALSVVGKFISNSFFISSQISFFASIIVLTASFFAYKNRINSRLENERDEILATIKEEDEEDEISPQEEIKEFNLKDEKARLKKQKFSFKDKSYVAAFMPYRLVAYAILFFGFIFLKNENLLNVPGFLVGLAPMPIGAFIFGLMENKFNTAKDTDGK